LEKEVTDEVWKEIESNLGIYSGIKLKIDNDEISIHKSIYKNNVVLEVYINGYLKGAETEENKKKYWFERKKMKSKRDLKFYKDMARLSTREEKKKYKAKLENKVKFTYYTWAFRSFTSLKSAYKKRHKKILWVKDE